MMKLSERFVSNTAAGSHTETEVSKVVLGCLAFGLTWLMLCFKRFPLFPIGRAGGAIFGAFLMVLFKLLSPQEALDAVQIDTLFLLAGMMLLLQFLESAGILVALKAALTWRCTSIFDMMLRLTVTTSVLSAFLTNDVACIFLAPFALQMSRDFHVRPKILLVLIATTSNIASACTPIGNPQNMVIVASARQLGDGKITFLDFLRFLGPSTLLALAVNYAFICLIHMFENASNANESTNTDADDSTSTIQHKDTFTSRVEPQVDPLAGRETWESHMLGSKHMDAEASTCTDIHKFVMKWSPFVVAIGEIIAFSCGIDLTWVALGGGILLLALSFRDAQPMLERIDYVLLVFFCGLFIATKGFEATEVPTYFWEKISPHVSLRDPAGISLLALIIVILSNVASNVPTVLLIGPYISKMADEENIPPIQGWLLLAFVSTLAGNATLIGSMANLIVAEAAKSLTFVSHLKVGFPSTLVTLAIGIPVLYCVM